MNLITIELADAMLAEHRRKALYGPRPSPTRRRRRMRRGRLPVA